MTLVLNGTTGVSSVDGSASTPAIQGTDSNTGVFFPAADTVAIATGGSERLRADSSGNVGIGTSSPASKLNIVDASATVNVQLESATVKGQYFASTGAGGVYVGSASAHPLVFRTDTTERMRIDSSGNVGIGTSSPTNKLHVQGAGSTYISVISQNAGSGSGLISANATNTYGIGAGLASGGSGLEFRDVTNSATRMVIDSSGNLLVGTTSASGLVTGIQASTSAYAGYFTSNYTANGNANLMFWGRNGGAVAAAVRYKDASTSLEFYSPTGHTVAYTTSSDYRLKENIQPMVDALTKVAALNPVTYTWKEGFGVGQSEGFIAHELQAVVPECVTGEKDAVDSDGNPVYQGIDTSFLVATLTAAIQELKAELDTAKARIAALEAK